MANRGGKAKDYRIPIVETLQWYKETAFDGLIIAEVYSSWFGPCEVMTPTINALMIEIDDASNGLKFLQVNVAKLEEGQRKQQAEEEKKAREMDLVQRRKGSVIGDASMLPSLTQVESKAEERDEKEEKGHGRSQSRLCRGEITIPLLSKYSGFEHPRPLWLFIKDNKILGELRSASPPRLRKLIFKFLSGSSYEAKDFDDEAKYVPYAQQFLARIKPRDPTPPPVDAAEDEKELGDEKLLEEKSGEERPNSAVAGEVSDACDAAAADAAQSAKANDNARGSPSADGAALAVGATADATHENPSGAPAPSPSPDAADPELAAAAGARAQSEGKRSDSGSQSKRQGQASKLADVTATSPSPSPPPRGSATPKRGASRAMGK